MLRRTRSAPIQRARNRAAADLWRSGGHRNRECPPVQRNQGGARPAARRRRSARRDQQLDRRHVAGLRDNSQQLRAAVHGQAGGDRPGRRRRPGPSRRLSRSEPGRCKARLSAPGRRNQRHRPRHRDARRRAFCKPRRGPGQRPHGIPGLRNQGRHRRADDVGRQRDRRDLGRARLRRPVLRQGHRAAEDVRRPGRDRDPERAAGQRDAGSARPAARLRRSARRDQQLDRRYVAGVRADPDELRAPVRRQGDRHRSRRRRRNTAHRGLSRARRGPERLRRRPDRRRSVHQRQRHPLAGRGARPGRRRGRERSATQPRRLCIGRRARGDHRAHALGRAMALAQSASAARIPGPSPTRTSRCCGPSPTRR